jgi:addiction module RelB/DinJ family antitoxin
MSKTANTHARVEQELKTEVEKIFSELGLTISEAVHLHYRHIRMRRSLPLDVWIP